MHHFSHSIFIRTLIVLSIGSTTSALAASQPPMSLNDFQPNCDIRQLTLTPEQYSQLKNIRHEYKKALDKARKANARLSHNRQAVLIRILSGEHFNENMSKDYIQTRFAPSTEFAIDELKIQHRFFQILSPDQRQTWLKNCLRGY